MPKFCANLSFLFTELPMEDRFAAAKAAGFGAAEVLFPYDHSAADLRTRLVETGLPLVLINIPPPNWAGGDRGFAAIPGGEDRFRHDFERALRFAERLKAQHLHVMAGRAEGQRARDTFIANLAWAAKQAPGQSLTIEPLNAVDMPGYFLNDFDLAAEVLETVAAPNLGLQFDAYHAQMMTGDMRIMWDKHGHRAKHIQIAGAPGRHEPTRGDIDYPAFFRLLDAGRYKGWVSAEYTPKDGTAAGLGWLRDS